VSIFNESAVTFLSILLASSVKASAVFLIAWAAALVLRRAHPRARHLLWLSALAAYPLVFCLSSLSTLAHASLPLGGAVAAGSGGLVRAAEAAGAAAGTARPGAAVLSTHGLPWGALAAAAWAAGALVSALPAAAGRLRIAAITRRGYGHGTPRQREIVLGSSAELGISRRVEVRRGSVLCVAFTRGILRPVIFLPATRRPAARDHLRAVIHHELWHIRRLDALSLAFSSVVRCLFWFVPFVWFAFSRQIVEMEKACDAGVLTAGVDNRRYAQVILDAARSASCPLPGAALLAGSRRRILKDRIKSIVQGGKSMKGGKWLFTGAMCVMAAVILLGGMAAREKPSDQEVWNKFVGAWVNEEYPGYQPYVQKLVLRPDMVGEDWNKVTDTTADSAWAVKVHKSWTDDKGYLYCQLQYEYVSEKWKGSAGVGLQRLDPTGKVFELNSWVTKDFSRFPEGITESPPDARPSFYFMYHRR
jgi:beta-lactamase regulating signal transducer with metallopeptidase domain